MNAEVIADSRAQSERTKWPETGSIKKGGCECGWQESVNEGRKLEGHGTRKWKQNKHIKADSWGGVGSALNMWET